ncbi:MAG: di-trans,poly-cis-decaprenylcistransferase [Azospirillaceae bacterium]|nr:di-trans,poly-cis-decaprenylcistransferase [Azospirillaceae bacterium]
MQSSCERRANLHVAIIMDGNGRWATRRGLPRSLGHRAGVEATRRVAEAAPGLGVTKLTLFAFSSDNWRRPPDEVGALMALLKRYLRNEGPRLIEQGTRLTVIGRRDRLPDRLGQEIDRIESATAAGQRLHLRIALDYSSREAILRAAARLGTAPPPSAELFSKLVSQTPAEDDSAPEVDLMIRSGGEKRLSDFLLWESAYAELWFTDKMWPDFDVDDLQTAIAAFRQRDRRFGGLSHVA